MQQRLQHIGDMRLFLDQKLFPSAETLPAAAVSERQPRRNIWGAVFMASSLVLAIALAAVLYLRPGSAPTPPAMRFELALPNYQTGVAVSPDGQRIAYIARPDDDNRAVWIRPVAGEAAQKLAGTDRINVGGLLWSPDGTSHSLRTQS
jgi:Tol biopolymer transport system component